MPTNGVLSLFVQQSSFSHLSSHPVTHCPRPGRPATCVPIISSQLLSSDCHRHPSSSHSPFPPTYSHRHPLSSHWSLQQPSLTLPRPSSHCHWSRPEPSSHWWVYFFLFAPIPWLPYWTALSILVNSFGRRSRILTRVSRLILPHLAITLMSPTP